MLQHLLREGCLACETFLVYWVAILESTGMPVGQLSWLHRIYDVRTLEERKSQAWQQIPAILAPRGGSRKIRSLRVPWATQKLPGQPEHGKTGLGRSVSVEHLPSTPQALCSSPSTRRKRQENMLCSPQATDTSPAVAVSVSNHASGHRCSPTVWFNNGMGGLTLSLFWISEISPMHTHLFLMYFYAQ